MSAGSADPQEMFLNSSWRPPEGKFCFVNGNIPSVLRMLSYRVILYIFLFRHPTAINKADFQLSVHKATNPTEFIGALSRWEEVWVTGENHLHSAIAKKAQGHVPSARGGGLPPHVHRTSNDMHANREYT